MGGVAKELFDDVPAIIAYLKTHDSVALRKILLSTDHAKVRYCAEVSDLESVWSSIVTEKGIVGYCFTCNDREELWQRLSSSEGIYQYCVYVKDRRCLRQRVNMDVCNWQNKFSPGYWSSEYKWSVNYD